MYRSQLSKVANLRLKIAFSRFYYCELLYNIGSVYFTYTRAHLRDTRVSYRVAWKRALKRWGVMSTRVHVYDLAICGNIVRNVALGL